MTKYPGWLRGGDIVEKWLVEIEINLINFGLLCYILNLIYFFKLVTHSWSLKLLLRTIFGI